MLRLTSTATAFAVALAVGLTAPAAGLAADCPGQDDSPGTMAVEDARVTTLCLVNHERTTRGLKALREHPGLRDTAQDYAEQMDSANFFDHVSPGGSTMLDRIKRGSDYLRSGRSWIVGENLAWGSGGAETPAKIVRAWMKSPGHRRNILNGRFRDIGIGITDGAPVRGVTAASGAATYVNNFGARS
ncbi:CAP domain-containing protein [Svornostia abyssi]|uniref:CAP domain-containing protein n=1 Tax=Svornostia abyssi TaxID=2898438 RepID=A0ABY5PEP8_9ACTN|nr:CAP domain-containing protein [Parviterribacteraceae bacterium J379]